MLIALPIGLINRVAVLIVEFNTIIKPNGEEINVQSRSQLINYTFRDLFDSGIIRESEREQQINELRLIEQRR